VDGAFRDPGIPDGERTVYRGRIGDEDAGRGVLHVRGDGDGRYVQRVEMQLAEELRYEMEARFARRDGVLLAEDYRLVTLARERRIAVEEGSFRDVRALHWGGKVQPYPRSIVPLLGCAVALRGLDFERGRRHSFALWLANTVHWEVELHVERRERVSVPAGDFDAWRVRARPSFREVAGMLDRVVAAVLPPFVLHFGAGTPHRFLRFSFPTGPFPWNPRGRIEAIELGSEGT